MKNRFYPAMAMVMLGVLLAGCPGSDDSGDTDDTDDTGDPVDVGDPPPLPEAFRGSVNPGLNGAHDMTNHTGEYPSTWTWDGKVVVRQCPDPEWDPDDVSHQDEGQPGKVVGQYWCFHAFRPALVTLDADNTPDFGQAFGPGLMSTDRHVTNSGGFPVVKNPDVAARTNPYRSDASGVACGVASTELSPPACPGQHYSTYDVYIVHTVIPMGNFETDYPDWPGPEGFPTYFEQMLIVVQDLGTTSAEVVDVIRDSEPWPMVADPDGFGFVYDADPSQPRNPYLFRSEDAQDTNTYIGGAITIEPAATVDGRMVVFNGGDEVQLTSDGVTASNIIYTWNPDPASQYGWSPPKNIAYMHWVEGPGNPAGETQITIEGVEYDFSDIFPLARQPLVDQEGEPFDLGSTYVPAEKPQPESLLYRFDAPDGGGDYITGAYPWISWDGRNIMALESRFNVAIFGDLTGYRMYWIDGAIDETDSLGVDWEELQQITAFWVIGQWPGRWAQYAQEFEGVSRTVPTKVRDAVTWGVFEQDHYSEISFHKTDGSYALYLPMSRMENRNGPGYKSLSTPDVSGGFRTGTLVATEGRVNFSQGFASTTFEEDVRAKVFGFSGQSIGFLADADDAGSEPHVVADALDGLEAGLTVEGAVYLEADASLPEGPWTTLVRQEGAFALGLAPDQTPYFEVTDAGGTVLRAEHDTPVAEDTWVHLAGVYDGASAALYVDGRMLALEAGGTGSGVAHSTASVYVGPKNDGSDPGGDGLVYVDEVGVAPHVLEPDRIAHNAYRQPPSLDTMPLADWESVWGVGSMPLGLVGANGALLAPIQLGFPSDGDLQAKAALGERLFADSSLSTTTPPIACSTCHPLNTGDLGTVNGEVTSTAGAGPLTRNTPTVFNRVFGDRQFWDARAENLGVQALFPIQSPVEMDMPLDTLIAEVLPAQGYAPDFEAAFGDPEITADRMIEALAVYESGLVAGDSAVDRYRLAGGELNPAQERGLALFENDGLCIGCHPPPLYTDERLHDNAQGSNADPGRGGVTGRPGDLGRFRTMSLRDVDRTGPYMHDGSVSTLRQVIELYNAGGDGTIGEMKPLGLTEEEIDDLVVFLEALRSEAYGIPMP